MLRDSYETTVGSSYNIDGILTELDRSVIDNTIFTSTLPDNETVNELRIVVGENPSLQPFNHPISYKDMVFVDARAMTKNDPMTTLGYKVTSGTDFKLQILRSKIQLLGMFNGPSYLSNIHPLPTIVYGRFISEGITFKLGLNPEDQMVLNILATAFYISQTSDGGFSNEGDGVGKVSMQISRHTHISPDIVGGVLADVTELSTLDQLLELMLEKVDNSRIKQLNAGLFFTTLTYGWKGSNSKELMGVSIEYPPTWMAIVASAITERLQKDSPVSKMVKNYTRRDMDREYILGLSRAIK